MDAGEEKDSEPKDLKPLHCVKGAYQILSPSDNDPVLYHGDDVGRPSVENVPDDFFDVTLADVGVMWKELQETRLAIENAPFTTSSVREAARNAEAEKTLQAHPRTLVRIRFPSRYVLQGSFRTVDKLEVVANFVRKFLKNENSSFYLFTTPPKRVLNLECRLIEVNLIGSAVIYIGSEEEGGAELRQELQQFTSDPDVIAEKFRRKGNQELERGSFINLPPRPESQLLDAPTTSGSTRNPSTEPRTQKIPKWFKTGK